MKKLSIAILLCVFAMPDNSQAVILNDAMFPEPKLTREEICKRLVEHAEDKMRNYVKIPSSRSSNDRLKEAIDISIVYNTWCKKPFWFYDLLKKIR